nr:hypothetical protein [Fodinicola feengrottensis]
MPSIAQRLYRGEAGIDFIGRRKTWYLISLAILVIALLSFLIRGFHFGIDFQGGVSFEIPASAASSSAVAEAAVTSAKTSTGLRAHVVSTQTLSSATGQKSYLVRIDPMGEDQANEIATQVANTLKTPQKNISENQVSASWGGQVTSQALIALAVFLALLIVYLAFRYEWKMAVGAIVALAHDLLIAAGIYSLVGFRGHPEHRDRPAHHPGFLAV